MFCLRQVIPAAPSKQHSTRVLATKKRAFSPKSVLKYLLALVVALVACSFNLGRGVPTMIMSVGNVPLLQGVARALSFGVATQHAPMVEIEQASPSLFSSASLVLQQATSATILHCPIETTGYGPPPGGRGYDAQPFYGKFWESPLSLTMSMYGRLGSIFDYSKNVFLDAFPVITPFPATVEIDKPLQFQVVLSVLNVFQASGIFLWRVPTKFGLGVIEAVMKKTYSGLRVTEIEIAVGDEKVQVVILTLTGWTFAIIMVASCHLCLMTFRARSIIAAEILFAALRGVTKTIGEFNKSLREFGGRGVLTVEQARVLLQYTRLEWGADVYEAFMKAPVGKGHHKGTTRGDLNACEQIKLCLVQQGW